MLNQIIAKFGSHQLIHYISGNQAGWVNDIICGRSYFKLSDLRATPKSMNLEDAARQTIIIVTRPAMLYFEQI